MKKRTFFILVMLILMGLTLWQCNSVNEAQPTDPYQKPSNPSTPEPMRAWTYLFYEDADFTPGADVISNFSAEMYGSEQLNVLVLRDVHADNAAYRSEDLRRRPDDASAAIFKVAGNRIELLNELGEVNMGKASTLADFITYGKTYFPAQRYILAVYNHGGGFSGSCVDHTDDDWLTMIEMREALKSVGGVDLVMFTAPCQMASLEALYEIRQYTKAYIASENLSMMCYWYGALNDMRILLEANPNVDSYELARQVVSFIDRYRCQAFNKEGGLTMSALRTDRLAPIITQFNEISAYYSEHKAETKRFLAEQYDHVQTYANYNMDLVSLIDVFLRVEKDTALRTKLNHLKALIDRAMLAEIHGSKNPGSHGLAIYCPKQGVQYYNRAAYIETEFAKKTKWTEVLNAYFNNQGNDTRHMVWPQMVDCESNLPME